MQVRGYVCPTDLHPWNAGPTNMLSWGVLSLNALRYLLPYSVHVDGQGTFIVRRIKSPHGTVMLKSRGSNTVLMYQNWLILIFLCERLQYI